MKKLFFLLIMLLSITISSNGQGTIRGKVTDETGQPLIGATVVLKSVQITGTVTDFDGNYSLKITNQVPQIITVSFVGYQTLQDTIAPINGEVIIKNFDMIPASNQIGEVTIVARAVKAKESYMEKIKINSSVSLDFISAATIKRIGDANVIAAVSRITGVSTYGGFITVRGIGDRYVKTSINGLKIPTLDPFTNNIRLDLFPASLVDNIVVNKTASADLPGDWSGAFLSIETKDYPEKLTINVESSVGYNSQSTFQDIVSSEQSSTDWLGFDNNMRTIKHEIPANYGYLANQQYLEFSALGLKDYFNGIGITENTPWDGDGFHSNYTKLALVQLGFLGKAQFNDFEAFQNAVALYDASDLRLQGIREATSGAVMMGQSLPNTWLTIQSKAPVQFSQSFSIGNQTNLFGRPLGYLFGFRYSSFKIYDENGFFGRTEIPDDGVTQVDSLSIYNTYGSSKNSTETNSLSALFNVSYKFSPNHSISCLFMPNVIGVNRARIDDSFSDKTGSPTAFYTQAQFYESRKQMVYQVKTNHYLTSLKMKIEMNASYTDGNSNSPDYRQLHYFKEPPTYIRTGESWDDSDFRLFRTLSEDLFDSNVSAEIPIGETATLPRKIKFGGAFQKLNRKSDQRYYWLPPSAISTQVYNNDLQGYMSVDSFALDGDRLKRYYWQLSGDENNTIGFSNTFAGFLMTDYALTPALRIYAGLRVEDIHLHTDIVSFYEKQMAINDDRRKGIKPGLMDNLFWLPSASVIHKLKTDKEAQINFRLNFSRTMALPSLRELTPFEVFDYTLLGVVSGNADLEPVTIENWDFRTEAYFKGGDNISMSLFYKNFNNHIEMVRGFVLGDINYSWQNAEKSSVMGIELEGRLGLTNNFELRANTTLVDSKTRLKNETVTRDMYGQAPYIINAILGYTSEKAGITASISFNVQGEKLVITGNYGSPDIYELPRNVIDTKLTKTIGKHFTASFRIRDLLNTSTQRAYKYSAGWVDFDRYKFGTSYIFALSYDLN